jgi:hypothetical protein
MKTILVAIAALLLCACGSLRVTTSVINPDIAATAQDAFLLREHLPEVRSLDAVLTRAAYERAGQRHIEALHEMADEYETTGNALPAPQNKKYLNAATDIRNITVPFVFGRYTTEATVMAALEQEIATADRASPRSEEHLAALLRQRIQRKRAFIIASEQMLAAQVRAAISALIGAADEQRLRGMQQQLASALDSLLIGDANITALREAFAVTKAEEKFWSPRFDSSSGTGRFGRVDVAIKMERRGVFTIKGITFDPSEVMRVASKATSQALQIGAQLAGVPIKSRTGTTGDGTALATSSGELADLQAQQATSIAKNADREAALLELATAVLAEEGGLIAATDEPFRAALAAIKAKATAVNTRLIQ